MTTYLNGRAPESALARVDGLHTVPSSVPRVVDLISFAATKGVVVRQAHPYGSYRTIAEQGALGGTGNSGSTVPVAAPGFSTHGIFEQGRHDFVGADGYTYSSALLTWLIANAPRFGLAREFGDRDPNHFMAVGDYTSDSGLIIPPLPRRDTMSDVYYKVGSSPTLFALAGSSPGTPANWLETVDVTGLALPWANVHSIGSSIGLTEGTWNQFKVWYLSPLSIDPESLREALASLIGAGGVGVPEDLSALIAAIQQTTQAVEALHIPTKIEGTLS